MKPLDWMVTVMYEWVLKITIVCLIIILLTFTVMTVAFTIDGIQILLS